jgi:hypothetical protein
MRSAISFRPIPVLIDGQDTEDSLVLYDGQLVAVLARLDGEGHAPELKGRWHLEAGLGCCGEVGTTVFENLDEAARWAFQRVQNGARLLRSDCEESDGLQPSAEDKRVRDHVRKMLSKLPAFDLARTP